MARTAHRYPNRAGAGAVGGGRIDALRTLPVVFVALLSACAAPQRRGAIHVERADALLAAGDLAAAARAYQEANRELDDPHVELAVRRGVAAIEREALRRTVPELAGDLRPHGEVLAAIHDARVRLRALGGDDAIDRELIAAQDRRARQLVHDAAALADGGRPFAAVALARTIAGYPDLDAGVRGQLASLEARAGRAHWERAEAAVRHPLTRRAHQGLAASYVGGQLDDAGALLAPFQAGVEVTIVGVACDQVTAAMASALARPGTSRRVTVELTIDACRSDEQRTTATQTLDYTVQVPETTLVSRQEMVCVDVPVAESVQRCSLAYAAGGARHYECRTEQVATATKVPQCRAETVTREAVTYRTEGRRGERTVTTRTVTGEVRGRFVIRRDGQELRGELDGTTRREERSYPALGSEPGQPPDPSLTTATALAAAVAAATHQVERAVVGVFAADIEQALAEASRAAAAGQRDDEEDALLRAVLLGHGDAGALAARYQVTAAELRAAFASQFAAPAVEVLALPAPTRFDLDRAEVARFEARRRSRWAPPMRTIWVQGDFAVAAFETRALAVGPGELAGDAGPLLAVRYGLPLVGALRREALGFGLIDDASFTLGLGLRFKGGFSGAGLATVQYAIAAGYRAAPGGLFVGVRPSAGAIQLGGTTGTWTSAPLFARLERVIGRGVISLDLHALSLAGRDQWGAAVLLSGERRKGRSHRFMSFRVERTATSGCADSVTCIDVDDLGLTYVAFTVGGSR